MDKEAQAKQLLDQLDGKTTQKQIQAPAAQYDIWTPIPDDVKGPLTKIMDTPMEDVYDGPRLETGIQSIDNRLYGGLAPGGMTIIAGHEGGGKTSWAMQIMAKALIEDEKRRKARDPQNPPLSRGCLVFSSEMPAKKLHRILSHQLAGPGEVKPEGNSLYPRYVVTDEVDNKIKQTYGPWIRGLEPEINAYGWRTLMRTCEEQAKQGRKYFILDNLMTLSNLVGMDPDHKGQGDNSLQLAVAAWAAEFAAKYDAWVILIAHTRKETQWDASATNLNDLISGSKTVPNLASVVLFFTMLPQEDRQDDPDTPDRLARLTKNRDHDKKLTRGVRTQFDAASWTVSEKE